MTRRWAAASDTSAPGILETLHTGLTVRMIMTPRGNLMTCQPHQSLAEIKAGNPDHYSYLPVAGDDGSLVGLFDAQPLFDAPAPDGETATCYAPLSEHNLIGADAGILDFVKEADRRPCCLVVSGQRIVGLVGLSDLQQLPVRAALFAVITGLELIMADAIRRTFKSPDDWMDLLSAGRRDDLNEQIARSKASDGFIDAVLFTQFPDKTDIVWRTIDLGLSRNEAKEKFKPIKRLRNDLAHANNYAGSPDEARAVAATLRTIYDLEERIIRGIAA